MLMYAAKQLLYALSDVLPTCRHSTEGHKKTTRTSQARADQEHLGGIRGRKTRDVAVHRLISQICKRRRGNRSRANAALRRVARRRTCNKEVGHGDRMQHRAKAVAQSKKVRETMHATAICMARRLHAQNCGYQTNAARGGLTRRMQSRLRRRDKR